MQTLPTQIYRAAEVRKLDQRTIEAGHIAGFTLMDRAGRRVFDTIRTRWPAATRLLVLCGAGNNAGDGYIVARLAREYGMSVATVALFDPATLQGDAARAFDGYRDAGGATLAWSPECLDGIDLVVDAIFGTGLARDLDARLAGVVAIVNQAATPVVAVDVPSGLHADTGRVMGASVRANVTVTLVGLKLGLYLGAGPAQAGEIVFDSLGIPAEMAHGLPVAAHRIDDALRRAVLPPRPRDAHKGRYGHVLVVGGGQGMPGAARLAGEGALRAGAGRVTVATWPGNVAAIVSGRPELMCHGVEEPADLSRLVAAADVIALGPGLGTDDWARGLMRVVETDGRAVIADADALNIAAIQPQRRDQWLYTPHPGEAGRLLGKSTSQIQEDRFAALAGLVARYGGVAVLKGVATLVGREGERPWICDRGNPGMASPGMGDVLTGVIAGIAAQCGNLFDAARVGVYVHGVAGDLAARDGQRGLIAADLCGFVRAAVN